MPHCAHIPTVLLLSVVQNSSINMQMYELANVISLTKCTHFKWCACCNLRTDTNFNTLVHIFLKMQQFNGFQNLFSPTHSVIDNWIIFPLSSKIFRENTFHKIIRDVHGYF